MCRHYLKQILTFIQAWQSRATLEFQLILTSNIYFAPGKCERMRGSRMCATVVCNWIYGQIIYV